MANPNPSKPKSRVNRLLAALGQLAISIDSKLRFNSDALRDDFIAHLGVGGGTSLPPGVITQFAGATAPATWALCDGSAVSRTTRAALFAAIGSTYGDGDGSTTFNLPDGRGRVLAGVDGGAGVLTGATLGTSVGDQVVALTGTQMPAHNHLGGVHSHGIAYGQSALPDGSPTVDSVIRQIGFGSESAATGDGGGVVTGDTGSDEAHPNVQPTLVVNFIIKL